MDRSVKSSSTAKSPARRRSGIVVSSGRSRSKSGGQQASKGQKSRARSKSRSKKESRSRSRARAKSKSPAPRTRSRSRRSTSRTRASSKGRKHSPIITRSNSVTVSADAGIGLHKRVNTVLKDLYHDDYVKDSVYEDIKRSLSREISQDKNSTLTRRYSSLMREASEQKEPDGLMKDVGTSMANLNVPKLTEPKKSFIFGCPKWMYALFGIFVPPLIILLHLACNKDQCTLSKFHIHRNIKLYLNTQSAIILSGFILVQTLLAVLPIGRKVGGPPGINGTLMYRCNGLLSTFISVGVIASLWYYSYPVTIVYEKMISMMVASGIFGYVLSILLFIKGGRASVPSLNPESMGENKLYQFFIGREINPILFGKINVKTLLLRISLNGLVIINGLLMLREYTAKHELNYTLTTCVALITILVMDFFWFEDSFPSTFEAMYEGTGCYLCTSYMLFPFFPSLITKYIIQHRVQVPAYGLAAIVAFFFVGYFIYRSSNLQKAAFRRNPLNPALAHFETISTARGKKLLVNGWWGVVRRPNYLGSIFLYWALASTAGFNHFIPFILPLAITLILIMRARRVDKHCHDRYQSAWDTYCSRVPKQIIPRVF